MHLRDLGYCVRSETPKNYWNFAQDAAVKRPAELNCKSVCAAAFTPAGRNGRSHPSNVSEAVLINPENFVRTDVRFRTLIR